MKSSESDELIEIPLYYSYLYERLKAFFKPLEIKIFAWKQYNHKTAGYFCALESIVLIKSPYTDIAAKTISKHNDPEHNYS